jgi:hypothetical protein
MLIIGILMLVLAVIVAQGLRPEEHPARSGPMISGTMTAPPEGPVAAAPETGGVASSGVLVPLDAGTLKMDSTTPAAGLAPVVQALPPPGLVAPPAQRMPAQRMEDTPGADNPDQALSGAPESAPQPAAPARTQPEKAPSARASDKLVVSTTAPETLLPGQKAIVRTRLELGSRSAVFRLTGASEIKGRVFALKSPERIVLDLNGSWAIRLKPTPANSVIRGVRAGNEQAMTRVVFDMHHPPRSFKLIQIDPKTLELQIRPQ